MDERKIVEVTVGTDAETNPGRGIRVAKPGNSHSYAIPLAMLVALDHAYQMVDVAHAVIMDHIGQNYPDAENVQNWLEDHADDKLLIDVQEAREAEHAQRPGERRG